VSDSSELAEDLRATIGRLVRTVRTADSLPPAEAAILGYLDRDGPQTTADLAQRRGVRHQSVARSVKELIDQDLVHSERHPTDGRKLRLHLTPAGQARLTEERRNRADRLSTAIDDELTPKEQQELKSAIHLLRRLTANLQ
jgi:DNA-binding MarR family transcriptional regulator